ncbi:MAG: hypothetical protein JWO36_704 [Myxococcales bacterium]|nr:hypothetical protein [Myxococcales bacterium]
MNTKAFLVDALSGALDIGLGTPEDVLRFVTPELLAQHLPRPLWARLLTACLGAPKVDAQLVVDTIGVPNLCEHIPSTIMWTVISEIATRALGGVRSVAIPTAPAATAAKPVVSAPASVPTGPLPARTPTATPPRGVGVPTPSRGVPLAPPPPAAEAPARPTPQPATAAAKTSIPAPASSSQSLANLDLDDEDKTASPAGRARTPTGQRFRQSQTGIGRMTSASVAARRPQAIAQAPTTVGPAPTPAPGARPVRRGGTEVSELETETSVEKDWGEREIAVDDEQLVDWQASDETVTGAEGLTRKR